MGVAELPDVSHLGHNTSVTHVDAASRILPALGVALLALIVVADAAEAQRRPLAPRPFPTVGEPEPEAATSPQGAVASTTTAPAQPSGLDGSPAAADAAMSGPEEPTEAELGVNIFPSARYITSYDAGRGQRFHLFGATVPFVDLVDYYSVILDERGRRVYDRPAIHQFETARFRDREMDYRPSVTIKDYTWNGSPGYLNPAPGSDPPAFPTIIQITTLPNSPAATDRR